MKATQQILHSRLLILAVTLFGAAQCGPALPPGGADVVFKNGAVYTVNKARPWARAVAVRGNRIAYAGDDKGVEKFIGRKTRVIDLDGKMPTPGVHYFKRDAQGNPTGWCLEARAMFPMVDKPGLTRKQRVLGGVDNIFMLFKTFGITTVYDAGFHFFEDTVYRALDDLIKEDRIPFRIVTSHYVNDVDQMKNAVAKLRAYNKKYRSGMVRARVLKIHNDGTIEGYTAAMFEPYRGQPKNSGGVAIGARPLTKLVTDVSRAHFDIHIHAIGDRAVTEALDAFRDARRDNPGSRSRFTIAHAELARDQDLERFGRRPY